MGFIEKEIEEVPAGHSIRALRPDIWTIDAAIAFKPNLRKASTDDFSILLVISDKIEAFLPPLRRERSNTAALSDIGSPVEECTLSSVP